MPRAAIRVLTLKVSEKFFENLSGPLNLFGPKGIPRLTQEIYDFKKFCVCVVAMVHEKPDVIGRRGLVPVKVLLHAPQPRLIVFVHTDLIAHAGAV